MTYQPYKIKYIDIVMLVPFSIIEHIYTIYIKKEINILNYLHKLYI